MRLILALLLLTIIPFLGAWACEKHEEQGAQHQAAGSGAASEQSRGGEPVFCTMEAKICPGGSAVSRTGPNCEFAPCPGQIPGGAPPQPGGYNE